ncbi:hypothetical protein TSTA_055670 [Talaromyces stipitatus ATCC 10500]|uniref:Aflatoxin regulatory protein domain-containing protein n=1 Tax=Talaromyces stipitatus (strain ATCC 10500 / CBS 375.48 / QM 6759 / NRRL 1006) TaxID=441959 RepID=B8MQ39_TALSN|nr:uncharacterized protein TSTA_055670 [Talaromyces stipitatus ATCC 10500]EED13065.1 hypothetical protein TSTA_055670 [Talaromyces stipitatus ATCC 10500]
MAKLGKPKGTRNKKTLERLNQMAQNNRDTTSSSESQQSRGQDIELEQDLTGSASTPASITQWMNWPALSSTCTGIDSDIDLGLDIPSIPSTFGLDAFLSSLPIDEGLQKPLASIFTDSGNPSGKRPLIQTLDLSSSDDDESGNSCECLRILTEQLCILNTMERRHAWISLDAIFSKTSHILDIAASVLDCQQCGIDSKVLLLIMILLQTVFNWAMLEQHHCGDNSNTPTVVFGKWKMSGEESDMVKTMLVNRVLARSSSITDKLRQRVTHISHMANNNTVPYQLMDAGTLEFALQRLVFSVREVVHRVKSKTIQP